jgi:hypothetical protein
MQFLASILFPKEPAVVTQYGQMLFMDFGKEFTSDKLSALMGDWTGKVLGWRLKIRDWRHVNIAWRRKLCGGAVELIEQQDAVSIVQAQQAGHSRGLENLVYGLSPDATLGAPEDTIALFLNASTDWQKVVKVVPGGLALPYKEATMRCFEALVAHGLIRLPRTAGTGAMVHNGLSEMGLKTSFANFEAQRTAAENNILSKIDEILHKLSKQEDEMSALQAQVGSLQSRSLGPPTDVEEDSMNIDNDRTLVKVPVVMFPPPGAVKPQEDEDDDDDIVFIGSNLSSDVMMSSQTAASVPSWSALASPGEFWF